MPTYTYKAKKGIDQVAEGSIEAANQDDALNKLLNQGLFAFSITETAGPVNPHVPVAAAKKSPGKKITAAQVLNFTNKLSTLVRAKVELLSSLRVLYEQTENPALGEVILQIYNATKEGKAFSESLERFPKLFSPLFINIIRSGEASGRLDLALSQISEFLSRDESLRLKVKTALAYPALLLLVGMMSIFALMNFVIPKLRPLFGSLGQDLPFITQVVLSISDMSKKSWLLGLIVLGSGVVLLYLKAGSSFFKQALRRLQMNLPVVSRLAHNQELIQFARSLGLLLESGVPALRSLDIAALSIDDEKLRSQVKGICKDVSSGQGIARSMQVSTSLPDFFTKMVYVGEESGRLPEVLSEIVRSYTQQVEADISLIASMLEPVLILVLGTILGTIVLAILLPVFQVTQMVH